MKCIIIILAPLILLHSLTGCSRENKTLPQKEIIKFKSGDAVLEGVLTMPANPEPHPLAVFVHGSGPATRNDYEEFVTHFLHAGIAVFRYDKRGVGASGGRYIGVDTENSETMFTTLASDAAAAIIHLKNDKRIDGNRIIVIGGSQAGWIIPKVNQFVDFWLAVCISGPSVTVGEEIYYSELAENGSHSLEEADRMLPGFTGPKGYDPLPVIAKMKSPSLWLFGGMDVSIPVKQSMHLLDSLKHRHTLHLHWKLYPEADHGLFNRNLGKRENHIQEIVEWIKQY